MNRYIGLAEDFANFSSVLSVARGWWFLATLPFFLAVYVFGSSFIIAVLLSFVFILMVCLVLFGKSYYRNVIVARKFNYVDPQFIVEERHHEFTLKKDGTFIHRISFKLKCLATIARHHRHMFQWTGSSYRLVDNSNNVNVNYIMGFSGWTEVMIMFKEPLVKDDQFEYFHEAHLKDSENTFDGVYGMRPTGPSQKEISVVLKVPAGFAGKKYYYQKCLTDIHGEVVSKEVKEFFLESNGEQCSASFQMTRDEDYGLQHMIVYRDAYKAYMLETETAMHNG